MTLPFGGLKYPSTDFFKLICLIEHVFSSVLTNENLALHGGKLLKVISHHLETNDALIEQVKSFFVSDNKNDLLIIQNVITYILKTYTRMRGKDIAYKIMARGSFKPKLHIRQKCAAVVDVDTYRKTKKKKKSIDANEVEKSTDGNEIDEADESQDEGNDHRELMKHMYTTIDSDSDSDSGPGSDSNDSDI